MSELGAGTPNRVLLREFLNVNSDAFVLLLLRNQPSILHYARGFFDDDETAINVTRRALRRGFRQLSRLRRNSLFSSYLIGVLREELKRRGKNRVPDTVGPLWAGLAGLPRVQREVVFYYFQGMPLSEVARIRSEAPSQTRSRFSKALCHVAKKAAMGGAVVSGRPRDLPDGCAAHDEVFLSLADALLPDRHNRIVKHAAECPTCHLKMNHSRELFARIREDITPFVQHEALLNQIPGPSNLTTMLGAAAVITITLVGFLLIRWGIKDAVTTVRDPAASAEQIRLLEKP